MAGSHFAPSRRSFPALLESLEDMIGFVSASATDAGLANGRMAKLQLAAEEALVNVINYAYPDGSGEVHLACGRKESRFTFEIRDSGTPYDPTGAADPDLTLDIEHRNIGGLGVFFYKKAMDEVRYAREDGQNVLVMELELAD